MPTSPPASAPDSRSHLFTHPLTCSPDIIGTLSLFLGRVMIGAEVFYQVGDDILPELLGLRVPAELVLAALPCRKVDEVSLDPTILFATPTLTSSQHQHLRVGHRHLLSCGLHELRRPLRCPHPARNV